MEKEHEKVKKKIKKSNGNSYNGTIATYGCKRKQQ